MIAAEMCVIDASLSSAGKGGEGKRRIKRMGAFMEQLRAVLFDMDGLMFDTERLSDEVWCAVSRKYGFEMTSRDVSLLRGRNYEGGRAAMLGRFGPDFPYDALAAEAHEKISARLARHVPLRPGLFELLDALRGLGCKMAVASSTQSDRVLHHMALAGVRDYFSAVIGGESVTNSKPDPEIFLRAAAALGETPASCMVLEDSYNGVRAGAASGCFTVMVPDIDPPTPEMEALADAVVPSLLDVIPLARARAGRPE